MNDHLRRSGALSRPITLRSDGSFRRDLAEARAWPAEGDWSTSAKNEFSDSELVRRTLVQDIG